MAWQRKTPFGYMVRGGETVPCPTEADAVQNIFTRYLAGASFGRIAEEMSRGNIPYHQHTSQWKLKKNTASMECIANDKDPVRLPWKYTSCP